MLRHHLSLLLCPLLLSACAATQAPAPDTAAAQENSPGLMQSLLNHECHTQLEKRQEWQMVALTMGKPTQKVWEDKICTCVSAEAAENLSAGNMVSAINPATRKQVLVDVAAKAIPACLQKFLNP